MDWQEVNRKWIVYNSYYDFEIREMEATSYSFLKRHGYAPGGTGPWSIVTPEFFIKHFDRIELLYRRQKSIFISQIIFLLENSS